MNLLLMLLFVVWLMKYTCVDEGVQKKLYKGMKRKKGDDDGSILNEINLIDVVVVVVCMFGGWDVYVDECKRNKRMKRRKGDERQMVDRWSGF
jgi:hypothetical protein